jgi:hypothetical protein
MSVPVRAESNKPFDVSFPRVIAPGKAQAHGCMLEPSLDFRLVRCVLFLVSP